MSPDGILLIVHYQMSKQIYGIQMTSLTKFINEAPLSFKSKIHQVNFRLSSSSSKKCTCLLLKDVFWLKKYMRMGINYEIVRLISTQFLCKKKKTTSLPLSFSHLFPTWLCHTQPYCYLYLLSNSCSPAPFASSIFAPQTSFLVTVRFAPICILI